MNPRPLTEEQHRTAAKSIGLSKRTAAQERERLAAMEVSPLRRVPKEPDPAKTNKGSVRKPISDGRLEIPEPRWTALLGLLSHGLSTKEAIRQSGLRPQIIEAQIRSVPERKKQWDDAIAAGMLSEWSMELVETIIADIATGLSVKQACEKHGKAVSSFMRLVLRDELTNQLFKEAQQIRALRYGEEIIEIADNDSADIDLTGKGSIAAVQRSRLRFDTRRFAMESWYGRIFGRKGVQVDVEVNINHAQMLEEARSRRDAKRVEARVIPALPAPEVPEAEIVEQPDTSWMD